jgi:hypothetical protein
MQGIWRPAKNWLSLQNEAHLAVEPELRKRWTEYKQQFIRNAVHALETQNLEELMKVEVSPCIVYECPPELAAKVIEHGH